MNRFVLIDESSHQIDKYMNRTSVCAVEYTDEDMLDMVKSFEDQVKKDTVRFKGDESKFHFSALSEDQRLIVVDFVSKLPIRAKIYSFYNFNSPASQAKVNSILFAMDSIKMVHQKDDIDFRIEHAEEYRGTDIEEYLDEDFFKFILPDSILHVFNAVLSEPSANGANRRHYTLLRENIRLQTYHGKGFDIYHEQGSRI